MTRIQRQSVLIRAPADHQAYQVMLASALFCGAALAAFTLWLWQHAITNDDVNLTLLALLLTLVLVVIISLVILIRFYYWRMRQIESEYAEHTSMLETLIVQAEQSDYVEFLYHISEELKTSLELHELLRRLIERSVAITQAERGSILLLDPDAPGGALVVVAGKDTIALSAEQITLIIEQGLPGWIIRTHQMATIAHVQHDERWVVVVDSDRLIQSVIGIPLFKDNHVMGVITLASSSPNYFTHTDTVLMSAVASQAATVLQQAHLYHTAQHYVDRLVALNTLIARLNTQLDRQTILDQLVHETTKLMGTDYCAALLPDPDESRLMIATQVGLPDNIYETCFFPYEDLISDVYATHHPIVCNDLLVHYPQAANDERIKGIHSLMLVPLLDRHGAVAGLMATGHYRPYQHGHEDIQLLTLLAHQAIIALENAQLYSEIQETNAQLSKANKLKSEFLAKMSHELRTPLNAIIGFSELTLEGVGGELTDSQRQNLERVLRNGQHLLELINEILDLSKIEAGRIVISNKPFDLHNLIYEILFSIQPLAEHRQLELRTEGINNVPPTIWGDEVRLRQVVINLLSNAIKFTPPGGYIALRLSQSANRTNLLIEVEDTGIGIEADQLDRIWDDFWQADSSNSRQQPGTGLGLAIVRRLTHLMGGSISVSSTVGVGSIFHLTLPLTEYEPQDTQSQQHEVDYVEP